MQHEKVTPYASRQLKVHERNSRNNELELVVVVFSLKIWMNYMYGINFEVYTYHKSLQYVFIQKELNL